MRQVILDTETTGLEAAQGHRVIEIGCVEVIERKFTGRTYHQYINPQREIDDAAMEVHGITNEFLQDKPLFDQIIEEFLGFIKGAELVIHNAPFDVGFLDHEFKRVDRKWGQIRDHSSVLDTLVMARKKHPGQKNNLNALCKRYFIDNSHRDLHGALLDAEILADVYLAMTGGQIMLSLAGEDESSGKAASVNRKLVSNERGQLRVIRAEPQELEEHRQALQGIDKASGSNCLWLAGEEPASEKPEP
ncbi:MAG: DNA polymerase III subunit epsilon [Gammaproteobacteria bacterium]|nr:MAG: DNA polymerase III subunit epsilon [Gammaproteobacteria bacterium]